MKPSQLAQSLKRIASGIEASKKPNKELVIRDLKRMILAINSKVIFEQSEDLNKLAVGRHIEDIADASVSLTGEDESYLPFENGFLLGKSAGNSPVWLVQPDDEEDGYFFIGTEDSVAARISESDKATNLYEFSE